MVQLMQTELIILAFHSDVLIRLREEGRFLIRRNLFLCIFPDHSQTHRSIRKILQFDWKSIYSQVVLNRIKFSLFVRILS